MRWFEIIGKPMKKREQPLTETIEIIDFEHMVRDAAAVLIEHGYSPNIAHATARKLLEGPPPIPWPEN
jgi:hypothetical protein